MQAEYSLDQFFADIKYKRNISKEGELEDGEVDLSSDELEPFTNQTTDFNKDGFQGTCTN